MKTDKKRTRPATTPSARAGAVARHSPQARSCCPVACTLDLIGDRWTLLVVRDLFAGKTRFADFARAPEGVATNILSTRLNTLVEHGLVEKRIGPTGGHASYHLTKTGKSLGPLLEAIRDWGLAHIGGTKALVHAVVPD